MIQPLKKIAPLLFALFTAPVLSAQDCSVDLSLGVILGNSQSYCAPFELTLFVDAPENPPETEYMFVLHDSGPLPHSTDTTLIYNQSEISNSVVFNLESSTCDASADGELCPIGDYMCKLIYSKPNDIMKLTYYTNLNLLR